MTELGFFLLGASAGAGVATLLWRGYVMGFRRRVGADLARLHALDDGMVEPQRGRRS